jgi:hypothetical protein
VNGLQTAMGGAATSLETMTRILFGQPDNTNLLFLCFQFHIGIHHAINGR